MIDFFIGHYAYWFIFILLTVGIYGMIFKKNLVKKVIGMSIFQTSIILFYVAGSSKWGATVPIVSADAHAVNADAYINPLPHTLMLTAIVVGVATSGVAFALIMTIYRRFKTLNEDALLEEMKNDRE